jgi:hypothetical protein
MSEVTDERLAQLIDDLDNRLVAGNWEDLAAALTELTTLRRQLREAKEALEKFSRIRISDNASGHDTVGYASGGVLIYARDVRALKELVK